MSRDLQERFSRLIDPNADKKLKLLVDFICLPLKFKFDEPFPICALVNNNARGRGLHCAFPKILPFFDRGNRPFTCFEPRQLVIILSQFHQVRNNRLGLGKF